MPAYDFSSFRSIADIGGGRGHFIKAILAAYPKMTGVLFDLPQVIAKLDSQPDPRLKVVAGDFFKDEMPSCDAWLMMSVIHDWSDDESIAILRNLRRYAKPATKLLLAEGPLPEADGPSPNLFMDIMMMAYATGRERKVSEYKELLTASGWKLERVVPTQGAAAILESTPV